MSQSIHKEKIEKFCEDLNKMIGVNAQTYEPVDPKKTPDNVNFIGVGITLDLHVGFSDKASPEDVDEILSDTMGKIKEVMSYKGV